jgi:hypothetical protein
MYGRKGQERHGIIDQTGHYFSSSHSAPTNCHEHRPMLITLNPINNSTCALRPNTDMQDMMCFNRCA